MNDAATALLDAMKLLANGRKRLDYAAVCNAFGKLFSAVTGLEQRRRLHKLLTSLEDAGSISLPAGKAHYERSAEPPMPRWIQFVESRPDTKRLPFDAAAFPWVPELRFAAELKNPQQIAILSRVHEFLATGGTTRCMVPVKERSVRLFGDEKKLDDLRGGALFRAGRLSLEMLRCFQVSPPLVWERGPSPSPRPALIIENYSTWHSFVRWNKDHGAWSAVCYGAGVCFETSSPSFGDIVKQIAWDGRLYYFGDLDPAGLDIPLNASKALKSAGLPPVEPQRECYECLLLLARSVELPVGAKLRVPEDAAKWFEPTMVEDVAKFFAKGIRIPQELLGYEELANGRLRIVDQHNQF